MGLTSFVNTTASSFYASQLWAEEGHRRAPSEYALVDLHSTDYKLLRNLRLAVEEDEMGAFVAGEAAMEYPFNVYGVGNSTMEAIADYASMLIEYYEELQASRPVLGHDLAMHLKELTNTIAPHIS